MSEDATHAFQYRLFSAFTDDALPDIDRVHNILKFHVFRHARAVPRGRASGGFYKERFILDDDALFRSGLARTMQQRTGFGVVLIGYAPTDCRFTLYFQIRWFTSISFFAVKLVLSETSRNRPLFERIWLC